MNHFRTKDFNIALFLYTKNRHLMLGIDKEISPSEFIFAEPERQDALVKEYFTGEPLVNAKEFSANRRDLIHLLKN